MERPEGWKPPDMDDFNPVRDLAVIREYAKHARDALDDEHEGNFKYYVRQISDLAARLQAQVDYM
jgi:hypothetical protein